jgi:hypothetical protein
VSASEQRSWNCPNCNEELGELNPWCEYCFYDYGIKVYNPDTYYIRPIRFYHLTGVDCMNEDELQKDRAAYFGAKPMNPAEQRQADFFTKHREIILVKNMNKLQVLKYIEEYSIVASEGRAAVYAGHSILDEMEKKEKREGKTPGFERNRNVDETTSEAINIIKKKRLSRKEQVQKQIEQVFGLAGNPDAAKDAAAAVAARNLDGVVNRVQDTRKPNPFAKKVTREDEAIAAILSGDTAKLIVKEPLGEALIRTSEPQPATPEVKPETPKKPMYKNPFAKKDKI